MKHFAERLEKITPAHRVRFAVRSTLVEARLQDRIAKALGTIPVNTRSQDAVAQTDAELAREKAREDQEFGDEIEA